MSFKRILFFNSFLLVFLSGCVMPEAYLKQTELQETEEARVIYKGNTVWLEPKHTPSLAMFDARVIYKMKKVKGGYAPKRIEYYDSTFHLITSDTRAAIEKQKYSRFSSKKVTFKFYTNKKELFEPEYINCAIEKYRYFKDGSFTVRYYDKNKNRRCGPEGFLVYQKMDTIQMDMGDSIVEGYTFKTIYKLDCNRDTLR